MPIWSDPAREAPCDDDAWELADHLIAGTATTIAPAYGFRAQLEAVVGGVLVGNDDVDYARSLAVSGGRSLVQTLYDDAGSSLAEDLRIVERAPRISPSPTCVAAVGHDLSVTGAVTRPVFVLKSSGGPDASASEEHAYLSAVERSGAREFVRMSGSQACRRSGGAGRHSVCGTHGDWGNRLPTALFGASGAACWRRLTEWHETGVWQQLHERLLAELRAAGLLDLSAALVGSTHLCALKEGPTPTPARSIAAHSAPSIT